MWGWEWPDIRAKGFKSIEDGLEAVAQKKLDAFVQDAAVVKHLVNKSYFKHLHVLPEVFNGYYVSMAIPEGRKLREPLNRALHKVIEKDQWNDLLNIYLGQGR